MTDLLTKLLEQTEEQPLDKSMFKPHPPEEVARRRQKMIDALKSGGDLPDDIDEKLYLQFKQDLYGFVIKAVKFVKSNYPKHYKEIAESKAFEKLLDISLSGAYEYLFTSPDWVEEIE